jgi:hypothetical protein
VQAADGRYVNTGVPRGDARTCRLLKDWLVERDLTETVEDVFFLDTGIELGQFTSLDPIGQAILAVERDAISAIAASLPAHEFFLAAQQRGLSGAPVNSPGHVVADPHLAHRGAFTTVTDSHLGRPLTLPAPPIRFQTWERGYPRGAPLLGEHNNELLGSGSKGTLMREDAV